MRGERMHTRLVTRCCLLAAMALPLGTKAQVDDFPNRPIRMVLPFPPGGSTDRIGRLVAEKMSVNLKQPVVVDYRPGAGGNIGISAVAKATPDGYAILLSSSTIAVSPSMYRKLDYDTLRDLAPIGLAARIPTVVCIHPSVPAKNLQELISLARNHPGKLNFGSGGVGTTNHLATEMLLSLTKTQMVHIPYKSTAQALLAMVSGESDLVVISTTAAIPLIQSGRVRALAVLRKERIAVIPNVPTSVEAGLPQWQANTWYGVLTRAGAPATILDRLSAALVRGLKDPDTAEKLALVGAEVLTSTPEEFKTYLGADIKLMGEIVRAAGIKPF
jgi:tripartite-type tricarboxylate transporter receptor subunit TctC